MSSEDNKPTENEFSEEIVENTEEDIGKRDKFGRRGHNV